MRNNIIRSPMFYVWDKYRLMNEIKWYFPKEIDTFIEPFLWWWSVFLNTNANAFVLNDISSHVISVHKYLQEHACKEDLFFSDVLTEINKYWLSKSYIEDIVPKSLKRKYVKTYYSKFNKTWYEKLRDDFNNSRNRSPLLLYLLLIYWFNRMIRFNSSWDFNIPTWNVDFNKNVLGALKNYFQAMKTKECTFLNKSYWDLLNQLKIKKNDFIYLDPPYLITFSEYNKIWNENEENKLLDTLDDLNRKNIRFAISNVTHYKGRENSIFIEWMKKYRHKEIKSNYISYHDNSKKNFKEVLVYNY